MTTVLRAASLHHLRDRLRAPWSAAAWRALAAALGGSALLLVALYLSAAAELIDALRGGTSPSRPSFALPALAALAVLGLAHAALLLQTLRACLRASDTADALLRSRRWLPVAGFGLLGALVLMRAAMQPPTDALAAGAQFAAPLLALACVAVALRSLAGPRPADPLAHREAADGTLEPAVALRVQGADGARLVDVARARRSDFVVRAELPRGPVRADLFSHYLRFLRDGAHDSDDWICDSYEKLGQCLQDRVAIRVHVTAAGAHGDAR